MDPRHQRRIKIFQTLYQSSYFNNKTDDIYVKKILENLDFIDNNIKEFASKFPIEKISRIDLSILRLAIFELLIEKKEPIKVIIDEAVELAKEFGGENSYKFINGVLGNLILKINKNEKLSRS